MAPAKAISKRVGKETPFHLVCLLSEEGKRGTDPLSLGGLCHLSGILSASNQLLLELGRDGCNRNSLLCLVLASGSETGKREQDTNAPAGSQARALTPRGTISAPGDRILSLEIGG